MQNGEYPHLHQLLFWIFIMLGLSPDGESSNKTEQWGA
jgi:hypothetical protein